MKKLYLVFLLPAVYILSTLLGTNKVKSENFLLVINELMPNPVGSDPGNEWIELYNPSDTSISLDGWALADKSSSYSLNGKNIEAKSYLIIFPTISLNNTDEEIILSDNQSYKDVVNYSSSNEGRSLERISPFCLDFLEHPSSDTKDQVNFNSNPDYCSSQSQSEVKVFTKEKNSSWSDIHVYILGSTIQSKYEFNTSEVSQSKWSINGKTSEKSEFEFLLEKIGESILKLELKLTSSEVVQKEIKITTEPYLKLNEIFPDPEGSDSGKEWIEIHNPLNQEVNLENWEIKVGSKLQKIENLKIPPKGFSVITSKVSLSNSGAEIVLLSPTEIEIDSFQYSDTETNKSWSREKDGAGEWFIQETSKGKSNEINSNILSGNVVNENKEKERIELNLKAPISKELVKAENTKNTLEKIKFIAVNEAGFTGFMFGELIIFFLCFIKKEEINFAANYLLKLAKG